MEFRGVLFRSLAAAPGRALGRAAARRFQSVASRNEDRAGSALADGLAAVQLDAELVGDHLLAARLLAGLAAQVIAVRRLVLLEFLEGQRDLLARGGDRAVDLGDGTLDLAAPVERGLDEGGQRDAGDRRAVGRLLLTRELGLQGLDVIEQLGPEPFQLGQLRTEEHTSELQSLMR